MESFEYNVNPGRVVFGAGSINKLPEEIKRLNLSKPLLLSTPQQRNQVVQLEPILERGGIQKAGLFSNATMHTPTYVTNEALTYAKDCGADCLVSFGGGSTTGLGKAISIRTGLPHISIPTTYAGSEMTPILGETADGKKTTRSDPKILPGIVIYDVDFTMTLPPALSATSGVNAIAHAVEALYARNTNPVMNLLALEGTKSLAESLPIIVNDSQNCEARIKAQYGAWLCAMCLGSVGMNTYDCVAARHSIQRSKDPDVLRRLADVLPESDGDAINGLNVLLTKLKVKRGLKDFGMKEEDVDKAAEIAVSNPYWNPRGVEKEPLRETIRRCWAGEEARADL
ncbi:Maleylacetate reductase 1 [Fulvia fulva]|nr:Maleylacetate reductase 1 [Fulvia fulva]WPV09329.1 Maleylacetate reductase 1 [Fulvia fulva]WPV24250.1 Maleylacetate reductase 1 [Fulvia fulva]